MSGIADGLERLWTPHRMVYVSGDQRPAVGYDAPAGCPFCLAAGHEAAEELVVARGQTVFAILNLYPYNPGHLMLCPYRHVADYTDLDDTETIELAQFTQQAIRAVRRVSSPHGFNLGMNQGHVAGAGIAAHLHQHVVPRWGGDTNFMPIIGRTKVMPQLLTQTRDLLAAAWSGNGVVPAPTKSSTSRASRAATPAASRSDAEAASTKVTRAATPASAPAKARSPRSGAKRAGTSGAPTRRRTAQ